MTNMDYTKIKELIFKLLKEKYPSSFESFRATFGNVTISWSKDATYTVNQKPFDSDDPEHGPAIMIYIPEKQRSVFGGCPYLQIPLTNKEFLELQLILEEVYPNWVQLRNDDLENTLRNLVSPSDFDQAQEQILDA